MYGIPFACSLLTATTVRAICINDNIFSCMRAPPLHVTIMKGRRVSMACSILATMLSPAVRPIDPNIKSPFNTHTVVGIPSIVPSAVVIASLYPVSARDSAKRSR